MLTTIKINKEITKNIPLSNRTITTVNLKHDELILKTIRKMRKLGMVMIIYNETDFMEYTLMMFEPKIKRGK